MNPESNQFEPLSRLEAAAALKKEIEAKIASASGLMRADGSPVPTTWAVFTDGEVVSLKGYDFKVVRIGEGYLVLEPVGPTLIGGS